MALTGAPRAPAAPDGPGGPDSPWKGKRGSYGGRMGLSRGSGGICPRDRVGSAPGIGWGLSPWQQRRGHPGLTFSPLGPAGPGGPMGPVRPCGDRWDSEATGRGPAWPPWAPLDGHNGRPLLATMTISGWPPRVSFAAPSALSPSHSRELRPFRGHPRVPSLRRLPAGRDRASVSPAEPWWHCWHPVTPMSPSLTLSPLGPAMPAAPLSPGIPCSPGGPWAPVGPAGPVAP